MRALYSKFLKLLLLFYVFIPIKLIYYNYHFGRPFVFKKNANRVEIFDAENNLLATSMQTYSVYYLPYEFIDSIEEVAFEISKILNIDQKNILNRLCVNNKFVWIARHVSPSEANQIAQLGYSGIYVAKDCVRFYPYGDLFYHVLGKVDDENNGILGIEKSYNDYLSDLNNVPLKLSLKSSFQNILKTELIKGKRKYKAKAVAGVIVCAKTGKILGIFSKNDKKKFSNPHLRNYLNEFNIPVQGQYEIGSIMKVISSAMFLHYNIVNSKHDRFNIPGFYSIGSYKIKDYARKHDDYLNMNFEECFVYSSNVAFVMLAEQISFLDQKRFYDFVDLFSDFYVGNLYVKGARLSNKMRKCDFSVFSYGYGVSLSLLHYLRGFLRVVTGKNIFLHIEDDYVKLPEEGNDLLPQKEVKILQELLHSSFIKANGQLQKSLPFKVGGKTGTAKKHGKYGYNSKNVTSYIFVYPVDDPEIVCLVFMDEPNDNGISLYASQSAMLVAIEIMKKLFKVHK